MVDYRIDKKQLIDKFKVYVERNATSADTYNSKGKEVQYRNDYTVLDKLRSIYRFVINNIKIDIRREFIHDDKQYYAVLNVLNDRVNNKIRARSDGTLYVLVGLDKMIKFTGDDEQYQEYVYSSSRKQQQLISKVVEELNSVLEKKSPKEPDDALINDDDIPIARAELTNEEVADLILSNIPSELVVELNKGNFEAFDKAFSIFIVDSGINPKLGEGLLEGLHNIYSYSRVYWDTINEAEDKDDEGKTNTDQLKGWKKKTGQDKQSSATADTGIDKRRGQSRDTLTKKGLTAAGGVWQNAKGDSVAQIDDNGNIKYINGDEGGTEEDGEGISDIVSKYQQQSGGAGEEAAGEETEKEPEVETGVDDEDLEKIRKTFDYELDGETENEIM